MGVMGEREPEIRRIIQQAKDNALRKVKESEIERIHSVAEEAATRSAAAVLGNEAYREAVCAVYRKAELLVEAYRKEIFELADKAIKEAQEELLKELGARN